MTIPRRWPAVLSIGVGIVVATMVCLRIAPGMRSIIDIGVTVMQRLVSLLVAPLMLSVLVPLVAHRSTRSSARTSPDHKPIIWITAMLGLASAVTIRTQASRFRLEDIVPQSLVEAGSTNGFIPVAVFALLFGLALSRARPASQQVVVTLCAGVRSAISSVSRFLVPWMMVLTAALAGESATAHGMAAWREGALVDSLLLLGLLATLLKIAQEVRDTAAVPSDEILREVPRGTTSAQSTR